MKQCACGCGKEVNKETAKYIRGHHNRSPEAKEKKRLTYLKKYGVENPSQAQSIKDKKEQTCLKNYNTTHYMKTSAGVDKVKKSVMEKYGVENVLQLECVKKKIKDSFDKDRDNIIERRLYTYRAIFYDKMVNGDRLEGKFIPLFSKEEFVGVCGDKYKFQCVKCGDITESNLNAGGIPRCYTCNPLVSTGGQSLIECDIGNYISSVYKGTIVTHSRSIISPMELDFYLPEKNIAIEVDGNYWHSEIAGGLDKNYHLDKTEKCLAKGIRLIHIFEDEWLYQKDIVKSRLRHILGSTRYKLYARKCIIKSIDSKAKNVFLGKYHIQGKDNSSIRLGAFYRGRMVAVMTFGKRGITGSKTNECELMRYCSISSFSCIGVAGKLLSHFNREYKPEKLISYADRRWSDGGLYSSLGFSLVHKSPPNYYYMSGHNVRLNRVGYMKHKLVNILPNFDPQLTEWANMQNNGYDRIWDCGNFVFHKISS